MNQDRAGNGQLDAQRAAIVSLTRRRFGDDQEREWLNVRLAELGTTWKDANRDQLKAIANKLIDLRLAEWREKRAPARVAAVSQASDQVNAEMAPALPTDTSSDQMSAKVTEPVEDASSASESPVDGDKRPAESTTAADAQADAPNTGDRSVLQEIADDRITDDQARHLEQLAHQYGVDALALAPMLGAYGAKELAELKDVHYRALVGDVIRSSGAHRSTKRRQ